MVPFTRRPIRIIEFLELFLEFFEDFKQITLPFSASNVRNSSRTKLNERVFKAVLTVPWTMLIVKLPAEIWTAALYWEGLDPIIQTYH